MIDVVRQTREFLQASLPYSSRDRHFIPHFLPLFSKLSRMLEALTGVIPLRFFPPSFLLLATKVQQHPIVPSDVPSNSAKLLAGEVRVLGSTSDTGEPQTLWRVPLPHEQRSRHLHPLLWDVRGSQTLGAVDEAGLLWMVDLVAVLNIRGSFCRPDAVAVDISSQTTPPNYILIGWIHHHPIPGRMVDPRMVTSCRFDSAIVISSPDVEPEEPNPYRSLACVFATQTASYISSYSVRTLAMFRECLRASISL